MVQQMHIRSGKSFTKLHAMVMAAPDYFTDLPLRERKIKLSLLARKALTYSAELSGITDMACQKDENNAPMPVKGVYWSLSHADDYVAAIVAPRPVGIDIEHIDAFSDILKGKVAEDSEWRLARTFSPLTFYSFWTAKEAVLKAEGVGLKGLAECRIIAANDENKVLLKYKYKEWEVENQFINDTHLVSLTLLGIPVVWHQISHEGF
jgi:4'-phosphopantetheinyl transferase